MNKGESQPILIVEDSPEDYEATLRAFKKSKLKNRIIRCETGDDAIAWLQMLESGQQPDLYPRPGIVLLDLNLPGVDGREVIRYMKHSTQLRSIPVVVLTTSNNKQDISHCYALGANSYIQKPVNLERFIHAIQTLNEYWFEIVILPDDGMQ